MVADQAVAGGDLRPVAVDPVGDLVAVALGAQAGEQHGLGVYARLDAAGDLGGGEQHLGMGHAALPGLKLGQADALGKAGALLAQVVPEHQLDERVAGLCDGGPAAAVVGGGDGLATGDVDAALGVAQPPAPAPPGLVADALRQVGELGKPRLRGGPGLYEGAAQLARKPLDQGGPLGGLASAPGPFL